MRAPAAGGSPGLRQGELQADFIKGVLGNVIPDITEGFDLADKASEWADYIQAVYQDPLAVAEGEVVP